eukprot:2740759-Pyramimonas_sp.AAC.1
MNEALRLKARLSVVLVETCGEGVVPDQGDALRASDVGQNSLERSFGDGRINLLSVVPEPAPIAYESMPRLRRSSSQLAPLFIPRAS